MTFSKQSSVEPGSFRDRNGRIYYINDVIYRGLSPKALGEWQTLLRTRFFPEMMKTGKLIRTEQVDPSQTLDPQSFAPWAAVLSHQRIPFVSYPYEWSFSMLKDAALLQLELLDRALAEDMTLKDASSFNIQWIGASPIFIDIPSFEKLVPGTAWTGYRQFCKLFLYPLFLQAYKEVAFHSFLRGNIDGVDPEEMNRLVSKRDLLRPGVLMDVYMQAKLQKKYASSQSNVKGEIKQTGFGKELIRQNVRRLTRILEKLNWRQSTSTWSDYAENTSYTDSDTERKINFVRDAMKGAERRLVWDLGCNTGRYSRIAAENSKYVIAMDADHLTVDRLYRELKTENNEKILPIVMNIADASPNLGWRGKERKGLAERGTPDLTLALALIHHVVIGANIPLHEFVEWLSSLGSDLVVEFVTKEDPMVKILLTNKEDQYAEYTIDNFEAILNKSFRVLRRESLASQTRYLFHAVSQQSLHQG